MLRKAGEHGEAEAAAEFAEENAKDTKRQADAGIQTIKFDGADAEAYRDESLRGRLGGRHQAEPRTRPEAEGILLEANKHASFVRVISGMARLSDGTGACSMHSMSRRACCCCS